MRMLISFLISAPMIFMIFLVMAHLAPTNAKTTIPIERPEIPTLKNPTYDPNIDDKEPRPEIKKQPQVKMPEPDINVISDEVTTEVELPALPDLPQGETGFDGIFSQPTTQSAGERMKGSHEAVPWMISEPRWPLNVKTSGKVRFCFTVNTDGRVSNIKLVHSEPGRVFVKTARKALRKWKFKPEVDNGINVARDDMCYTMNFEYSDADEHQ